MTADNLPDPFEAKAWPKPTSHGPSAPPAGINNAYRQELLDVIIASMDGGTRSQQVLVGPSELGTPCDRKLAHRLAYGKSNSPGAWRPTVGTAVHAHLDSRVFRKAPEKLLDGKPRWLSDVRIPSHHPGVSGGTADLFDRLAGACVDFKVVGPGTIKSVRGGHISPTYELQVQVYGLGLTRAGHSVHKVALLFLPSCGELSDAIYREWNYDEAVALRALERVTHLQALISAVPDHAKLLGVLDTADDWCSSCGAMLAGLCGGVGT